MWVTHSDTVATEGYCWILLIILGPFRVLPCTRTWSRESSDGGNVASVTLAPPRRLL